MNDSHELEDLLNKFWMTLIIHTRISSRRSNLIRTHFPRYKSNKETRLHPCYLHKLWPLKQLQKKKKTMLTNTKNCVRVLLRFTRFQTYQLEVKCYSRTQIWLSQELNLLSFAPHIQTVQQLNQLGRGTCDNS